MWFSSQNLDLVAGPLPYGHKISVEQEFLHLFISLNNYFHLWTGIASQILSSGRLHQT